VSSIAAKVRAGLGAARTGCPARIHLVKPPAAARPAPAVQSGRRLRSRRPFVGAVSVERWPQDYDGPREERGQAEREVRAGDPEAQEVLDGAQYEVDLYSRYAPWYGSAFL
jgi:hypothetical protein